MESFDSLASLGHVLSALPGHASLPETLPQHLVKQQAALGIILAQYGPDDMSQLDAVAECMHYFCGTGPAPAIIQAYLASPDALTNTSSPYSLQNTVTQLAEPIERAYTSADHGRLYISEELAARRQRIYHTPEKALEEWGPEQDLDELAARAGLSAAIVAAIKDRKPAPADLPTVEDQLWALYYTFLHEARRIPWRDEAAQQKLVDLLAALQRRPDPPRPAFMTVPLSRHWIFGLQTKLWSHLAMFGPAARESWNDSPGCGAGWLPVEIAAWQNVNGFLARVTAQGLMDYTVYGAWALYGAVGTEKHTGAVEKVLSLKDHHRKPPSFEAVAASAYGTAEVWLRIVGRDMFRRGRDNEPKKNMKLDGREVIDVTVERWDRWRSRLDMVTAPPFSDRIVKIAEECATLMVRIEEELKDEQGPW
ncbi:hypothetical protein BD289DRAFT_424304 [Coniella lustricola]|uniref:Uncharacterized protein n=1 Tax=Coniella lustricola TaxID=2025994 RepID=A0A2T3AIF1_9PEZI|nr:hypothetical protein BD289DRAFT_424304 [Coniella lustricola]